VEKFIDRCKGKKKVRRTGLMTVAYLDRENQELCELDGDDQRQLSFSKQ
jgi:hypothetical protein